MRHGLLRQFFPFVGRHKIQLWPNGHYKSGVYGLMTAIVVSLVVFDIDGLCDARHLVNIAGIAPQVGIIPDALRAHLK